MPNVTSRADSEALFLGLGDGAFRRQHGRRVPEAAIAIDQDVGVAFAQDADVWVGVGLLSRSVQQYPYKARVPCERTPRKSELVSRSANCAACAADRPAARRQAVPKVLRSAAAMRLNSVGGRFINGDSWC